MHSFPTKILNEIAKTPMRSTSIQALFNMTTRQRQATLASQAKKLTARGFDAVVILSYQTMWPLWTENEAITSFILKSGNSDLRMQFPEITSSQEAMLISDMEWNLNPEQKVQLNQLLNPVLPHKQIPFPF